jgi:hypothetical protein
MPGNSPYRPADRWAGWSPRPGTARLLCGGASQRGARDGGNGEAGGGDGACYRMPAGLMTWDDPGVFSTGPGARIVIGTFAWHAACFANLTSFPDVLGRGPGRPRGHSGCRCGDAACPHRAVRRGDGYFPRLAVQGANPGRPLAGRETRGDSSIPPSADDLPGKTAPQPRKSCGGGKRRQGKQPGAPGAHLAWRENPDTTA